jgi:excisionase family DNA binding protein
MARAEADDALLSVAQAATLLGVHPNTIRAWTDGGRLTAYRINARGDRRFRRDDVARLLVEDGASAEIAPATQGGAARDGELAIFGRIAAGLAASPTSAGVARTVVEALRTETAVERVAVYVSDGERLELEAHAGFAEPPPPTREPVVNPRTREGDDVALTLTTRRGNTGLLVIDHGAAESLAPAFVRSLVAIVGTTIASTRLLGRARRELQRARALRSVTKELTGTLDLNAVLGEVVDLTRSLFEADKAGLWLVGDGEFPFSVAAQHGLSEDFLAHVAALRGNE